MAHIDRTKRITLAELKRIESFRDFAWELKEKIDAECERQGIEPDNCPISADLSAVLGSLEYFIQEHDCTA